MGVTLYFQDEARVAHSIFMWLGICLCFTIGILSTRTITKKAFVPVKGSAFWKLEEKFKPHCFHVTFQVIGFVFVVYFFIPKFMCLNLLSLRNSRKIKQRH
mmetsp:Transcript_24899/g.40008  ORF Transcript_24899/g.40008 Transcript_24899/m.40008 type:complete len:101 (-) Transcript_24899:1237-1539(-)